MKKCILAISLGIASVPYVASAAESVNPAVAAYYHDMLLLTQQANSAGEACMTSLKGQRGAQHTRACRAFEQRYRRAIDQSEALAAHLKVAGQTLHRSDPHLDQLSRATDTLNRYMDSYRARMTPEAEDVLHISEEPAHK